jgi:NAD(P)-dependent dehydrogenase (short-subunit alcohol dehydrogenase family)
MPFKTKRMKAVVITGGAKRLGAHIAKRFAAEGWRVFVHCNTSRAEAEALRAEIVAKGGVCSILQFDLANPDKFEPALSAAVKEEPGLCALVNSASLFEYDEPKSVNAELWRKVMNVNALAPVLLSVVFERVTRAAVEQRVVINVLDQKLANLNPDFFSYTASKAALECASKMMAAAFEPGMRVCNVAPGIVMPSGGQSDNEFDNVAQINPLQRKTMPEDVADAIVFAASGKIGGGQTIFVDSGQRFLPLNRDVMFTSGGEPS